MKDKAAIVIPVYKPQPDRFEEVSFVQCLNVLGGYPLYLATYDGLDVSYYTLLLETYGCRYEIAAFDKSYFNNGLTGYNRLLLLRDFYETFCQYEYILVYQLDAYVFKNELDDWCNKGYAYIGAPWFEDFGRSHAVSPLKAVGNGGFSLRHIPSFLSVFDYMDKHDKRISAFNYWNRHLIKWYYGYSPRFILSRYIGKSNTLRYFHSSYINEDAFWSQVVPEAAKSFRVAPIVEAIKFSFETDPEWLFEQNNRQLPFGCHAWQKNQYDTFWSKYIRPSNLPEGEALISLIEDISPPLEGLGEAVKLSVITINFNNKQGLEKTMESVFAQSYTDFEYLVIDGGSTDGSVEIIRNYELRITNGELPNRTFRWVSEPDKGIYNAMNKGIEQGRGVYCYFLNSGDYLASEDVFAKVFAGDCSESFICGNFILDKKGVLEQNAPYKNRDWQFSLYDIYSGFLAHQAFFIKREMFGKYGLYDEHLRIMSDWKLFFIAIGIHDESVAYKDVTLSVYDTEGLSSRIGGKAIYEEKLKVAKEELSPQLAQKLDRLYYLECNGFWIDFIHSKKWIHFLCKGFLKVGKMIGVTKFD